MAPKSHHTAVVVIPPETVWPSIQEIRRTHDRNVDRWMPHVTLLYPFLPPDRLGPAETALAPACARVAPFDARLGEFRFFDHQSGRATIWLAPEPRHAFIELQSAVQACFPDYDDVSRHAAGFEPHLSVGQARSATAARALVTDLQAVWRQLVFPVDSIAVIRREGDGPFRLDRRVLLA